MRSLILCGVALLGNFATSAGQPAHLEITIAGAAGDTVLLAAYYGNLLFYTDTAVADASGRAVFDRQGGYPAGQYVVLPKQGRIPIVVNEPRIVLTTDMADPAGHLRVIDSRENTLQCVDRARAEALAEPERTKALNALVKATPGTFVAALIRMEQEPARRDVLREDGSIDSSATSNLQRAHYWDNTDLTDERIIRTPVFQNRLEALLALGIAQQPDTVVAYFEELIARAGKAEAVKQFLIQLAVRKYADQPTQGMGAVSVRLAQRHVCTAPAGMPAKEWAPVGQWRTTCGKVARKAALIIGARSRDIVLADTTATHWVDMHQLPQSCVVIVFWSPECGHCKAALPLLHEKYLSELKAIDVEIYAVAATPNAEHTTDWKRFIKDKDLQWVNVSVPWPSYTNWRQDPTRYNNSPTNIESLNYEETWEVTGTPQFYVLDKERRIVAHPASINDIVSAVKALQAKQR